MTDSSSLANLVILRDCVLVALTLAARVGIRIGHRVLRTLYLYIFLFFLLNTLVATFFLLVYRYLRT